MSNNVTILKLNDTDYRISGYVVVTERIQKSVVVEGETYYKFDRMENIKVDLDAAFENNRNQFWKINTDFLDYFNVQGVNFYTYQDWHKYATRKFLSENEYVSAIQVLNEQNVFPFKIYCGKNDSYLQKNDFYKNNEIPVHLFTYGWNNTGTTYITYQEYLKSKIPSYMIPHHYYLDEYFPTKIWELSDERKSELLMTFINQLK